jgi:hypothetical protein
MMAIENGFAEENILIGSTDSIQQTSLKNHGNIKDTIALHPCTISEDLASLVQSKLFSDVELHTMVRVLCVYKCLTDLKDENESSEGASTKAHKCLLAARSRYFNAMFTSGMKETHDSSVKLSVSSLRGLQCIQEYLFYPANEILLEILLPFCSSLCGAMSRMATESPIESLYS